MHTLKEYNAKLNGLRNMRKMTKTMKMVSATKFTRAQDLQRKASAFEKRLDDLIGRLSASCSLIEHPLLTERKEKKNILVLVASSDRGLCGGFNNNLVRYVAAWIKERSPQHEHIDLSFFGRRGFAYFRRKGFRVQKLYEGITVKPQYAEAQKVGLELRQTFLAGQYDEIHVAWNMFQSAMVQRPVIMKWLPLGPEDLRVRRGLAYDYLFEPPQAELLAALLPIILDYQLYYALLENAAGEHGARMTAMDNATSNADKMIDLYTLWRNRARQSQITGELIEVVSGAEALKRNE